MKEPGNVSVNLEGRVQKCFIFPLFKSTYNIVPFTPQFAVSKGHTLFKPDIHHLDNDTFSFQSARGVRAYEMRVPIYIIQTKDLYYIHFSSSSGVSAEYDKLQFT